jgi:hypothetical protein
MYQDLLHTDGTSATLPTALYVTNVKPPRLTVLDRRPVKKFLDDYEQHLVDLHHRNPGRQFIAPRLCTLISRELLSAWVDAHSFDASCAAIAAAGQYGTPGRDALIRACRARGGSAVPDVVILHFLQNYLETSLLAFNASYNKAQLKTELRSRVRMKADIADGVSRVHTFFSDWRAAIDDLDVASLYPDDSEKTVRKVVKLLWPPTERSARTSRSASPRSRQHVGTFACYNSSVCDTLICKLRCNLLRRRVLEVITVDAR